MAELIRMIVIFLLPLLPNSLLSEKETLNPFPLGSIGCLIADVCGDEEICSNDLLFGSCRSIFSRDRENRFELRESEIQNLQDEIEQLIKAGFTWKDALTQCILQNSLLELGRGLTFNRRLCEVALGVEPQEDADIPDVLHLLENRQDQMEQTDDILGPLDAHKRNEIVQVHKYFDKSKSQIKRDPYSQDLPDYYPSDSSIPYFQDITPKQVNDNGNPFVDNKEYPNDASNLMPSLHHSSDYNQVALLDKNVNDKLQIAVPEQDMEDVFSIKNIIDNLVLTSSDEEALEKLLEGDISPGELGAGQQKRLRHFVKGLIKVLEISGRKMKAPYLDKQVSRPAGHPVPADTEKSSYSAPIDAAQPDVLVGVSAAKDKTLVDEKTMRPEALNDRNSSENNDSKKKFGSKEPRFVDAHFVYLQLSNEVSINAARLFVQNLTELLKIPRSLVQLKEVGPGRMISLRVRTDPRKQWDAEKIAKGAQSINQQLKKVTGLTVEGAGVGRNGNRVEVKQNDSHVVLAFILVGTIAGLLLAVVTLYLIKQHARSKQKLVDISSSEDVQEASRDYQELCRQRMQGKATEKPEPLHAATRVGSISESQVRSPSSRSSTSSWSEEPAPGNMDIFTGHIVLSYMEDHLKNQDRLDREWEAISSYVPDPSNTNVGSDQSNMRKNRFDDILPYDHSRVILSTDANVSTSDYINASFITDHDPRNPAYVCTQGPLPHTVADFWQMIWEQGSVVIVMLTKLIEDDISLSHRYWPEEGSDLYHVYEVHLVSEHIWCDDYLVRSFYLKNLQTSETRTVTQFHFLTWPELSVPASIKALLDFRRKVNKSFRGRSCPIVVHCSDGCGRSGTYCLIDMVLNKMAKGAKEIDMAATLEHIRDQRMLMVKTKEQFQFSLAAVAEEVHAILKALPQ